MIISLPKASKAVKLRSKSGEKELDLVISPEIRRVGNVEGGSWEQEEIVRDCKGDLRTYMI